VAELRVDDAARSRSRRSSLAGQALEEATLRGVLVDLGERGAALRLELVDGRGLVGQVHHLGADVATVHGADGQERLVALAAVVSATPQSDEHVVTGDRVVVSDLTLAEALGWLAGDRPRVHLHAAGGSIVAGELRSVGVDVATVLLEGRPRRPAYVALRSVTDVLLLDGAT